MSDVIGLLLVMTVGLAISGLFFGWVSYKLDKLKKKDKLNIETIGSIIALEKAMKKLNEALKIHEHRLDHERDEIYGIQKRLDILEEGHPDTDIDYGTVDDDGNITEVWFEGKRYVPEDKRNDVDYTKTDGDGNILAVWFHGKKYIPEDKRVEDAVTLYADNKIITETTRPEEKRCCATCKHYRPGSDHTCTIRYWLQVTKARANEAASVCNNYEKTSAVLVPSDKDKAEYIRFDRIYWDMGKHNEADRIAKRIDELQCEIQRLNLSANMGCIAQELRQRWEELMRDDT